MREALSELMAGLKSFDVGGVFLLEDGRLVLKALEGPLEVLMRFADQVDAEDLMERTETKMVADGDRPTFWASSPFCNGDERRGLLVLGRGTEIEPDFLKFMKDIAWHLGKMVEISRLRRSQPQSE